MDYGGGKKIDYDEYREKNLISIINKFCIESS